MYGFYLSSQGRSSYGELVSFMLLAFRVATPMGALTSLYASAQGAAAAAAPRCGVRHAARDGHPVGRSTHGDRPPDAPGALELRDVWFRYAPHAEKPVPTPDDGPPPRTRWTLQGITTRLAPGEKVALVGPSGAGKTTLAGLVLRLFAPTRGELYLGGRPYSDIDLRRAAAGHGLRLPGRRALRRQRGRQHPLRPHRRPR